MKNKLIALGALMCLAGAGCTTKTARVETTPAPAQQTAPTPDSANSANTVKTAMTFPGKLPAEQITNKEVRIHMEKGDIVLELYPETAPLAVSNFVSLINSGFYNGLTFHRREEGFVIQGGDPSGNGTGGPGYTFGDELTDTHTYNKGVLAMANRGPNTNGSQFFIMLDDVPQLPKLYTIFGKVISGQEIVDSVKIGDKMLSVTVEDKK